MKGRVYVLRLKNWRYYVWSTNDLSRRTKQHNDGQVISTKNFRPLEIIYSREFDSLIEARQKEYRLKKQKSKQIIEKFIMDQLG